MSNVVGGIGIFLMLLGLGILVVIASPSLILLDMTGASVELGEFKISGISEDNAIGLFVGGVIFLAGIGMTVKGFI